MYEAGFFPGNVNNIVRYCQVLATYLAMHISKLRIPIYYQFGNQKVPTTCQQNKQQTCKQNSCVSAWCRATVKSHAGKKTRRRKIQQQISLKILKFAFKTAGNSSQGYNHQPLFKGYNPCTSHQVFIFNSNRDFVDHFWEDLSTAKLRMNSIVGLL